MSVNLVKNDAAVDPTLVNDFTPSAEHLRIAVDYMQKVERTVTYEQHPSGVIAALSPIPNDPSGSVELTYGTDHVKAFVSLAMTLRHNDTERSVRTEQHVNYPHEAGYLIGCGACEAQCVCADEPTWAECVWVGHDIPAPEPTRCPEFDEDGSCIHSDHMLRSGR